MRVLLALLALVAALIAPAGASAELRFARTCGGNFECARLKVPLDRSGAVPGTVRLSIERARSQGRGHEGAVFALAGGPGQGASSATEAFHADVAGRIGTRDLIVVDQRGTGRSGALDCPDLERPDDRPIDVRTAACARRLGPRRSFYTTQDSVEDLDAVRRALGIDRITLLGVSYGTKVALTYAQRFPEHVERLVLDSVVAPEGQSPFDLDSFAALPRVFTEMCRGECAGITDDLAADVAALVDRMRARPVRGAVLDRRGRRHARVARPRDLYQLIRAGDGPAELRVEYPGAVRAALDGDTAPLLRALYGGEINAPRTRTPPPSLTEVLSFTLQAATLCEEAPLPWDPQASPAERDRQAREAASAIPDDAFEPFDRATALARDSNNLLFQCRRWPAGPDRPEPGAHPFPDVPVLVLEGLEDTRTPLEVGARVAEQFPQARLLGVPKTGHGVLGNAPCARTALGRFFSDRPLGDLCAGVRRRLRILPVPPGDLASVAPAGGPPGRATRTLAAVALTLADVRRASLFGSGASGGLRAGRYVRRGGELVLEGYSYVPGVRLSGPVSGPIEVRGRTAAHGTLTRRGGRLVGRLGGRRVAEPRG